MEVSNLVVMKDDYKKIIYVIEAIYEDKVYIAGLNYRIRRVVHLDDIQLATKEEIDSENKKTSDYFLSISNLNSRQKRKNKSYLLGKVLHIDGDQKYLDKCLELYKTIGVYANGLMIKEEEIHHNIQELVIKLAPDIVVITGHDVYNQKGSKDLDNYTNTLHYIKAVRKIREVKSRFDLTIIAGACQSNFEALIANGADFASSPKRINIHTFDPAVIAVKVSSTSIAKIVNLSEALRYIERGQDAFGGVECFGKMRLFV